MSLDMDRIGDLLESRRTDGTTHWGDCHYTHPDCAIAALAREVTRLEEHIAEDNVYIGWLRDGIENLLRWRQGDLPSLGYLRDNDMSREALALLAALLDDPDDQESEDE